MSELATIARPYAKAVFDLAVENNELDRWSEMLFFASEVTRNDTVSQVLTSADAPEKLGDVFLTVCGEQLNEFGQNLVKVMAENSRLLVIPEVYTQFMVMRHEYEKQMDVDVISATELSDAQRKSVTKKLEARFKRQVKLTCSVDQALLGGMIIRAGDFVIDNSIRGQVRRLGEALQS